MRRPRLNRALALCLLAAAASTGVALDLFVSGASDWFSSHQFVTTILAESILLGAVYIGVQYLVSEAEGRRWPRPAQSPCG